MSGLISPTPKQVAADSAQVLKPLDEMSKMDDDKIEHAR
jgi:hypothetical protein